MKTHVTVDGITLSRSQVEGAYKALNAVEVPEVVNLTRVQRRGHPGGFSDGVVITGAVQRKYVKTFASTSGVKGRYTVIDISGSGSTYETPEQLWNTWEVVK